MYVCMYIYIHTYIHTYIHAYIHTYIEIILPLRVEIYTYSQTQKLLMSCLQRLRAVVLIGWSQHVQRVGALIFRV